MFRSKDRKPWNFVVAQKFKINLPDQDPKVFHLDLSRKELIWILATLDEVSSLPGNDPEVARNLTIVQTSIFNQIGGVTT